MASFFFWVYLAGIHLMLVALVVCASRRGASLGSLFRSSSGKHDYYHRQMLAFQQRIDEMLPAGAILFVGDSDIQGLHVAGIAEHGVNFGIGGDTTAGVMERIGSYRSLDSAKGVVLAVGYNDLKSLSNDRITGNMEMILGSLPPSLPVVCCGIYPTDERVRTERWNSRIADLNQAYADLCNRREGTVFVDFTPILADATGNLRTEYSLEDGLHLNLDGRRLVVRELQAALAGGLGR